MNVSGMGRTVLVIDDDANMRAMVTHILAGMGCRTVEADCGEAGLALLRESVPDLVLLDHHMPGMEGFSVLSQIHTMYPQLPVLMMTADLSQKLAVQCFRSGAWDFIGKPFDPDFLPLVVGRVFDKINLKRDLDIERSARVAAEEADRLKTEFLSNVNHEIRQPLNIISMAVEGANAFVAQGDMAEVASRLERIGRNADRLNHMINGILDLAKLKSGRVEYSFVPTDLAQVFTSIVANLQALADERGLSLHLLQDDIPKTLVVCDGEWVAQVFRNLLGNAIKFADEKSEIRISYKSQDSQSGQRGVQLQIENQGSPLRVQNIDRLFEPFVRGDESASNVKGAGMGLALCKRVVESHGGTIWLENINQDQAGEGVRAGFWLPMIHDISVD